MSVTQQPEPDRVVTGMPRWVTACCVIVGAMVIAGAAWKMTGSKPRSATAPGSTAARVVPPLVLRDTADPNGALAKAAALLADGKQAQAARAFTKMAVAQPDAVEPQVGLILSRWKSNGPDAVIGDLRQVAKEHPDDVWVGLELAIAQLIRGDKTAGTDELAKVRRMALAQRAFDVARYADDLAHSTMLPGYPPIVVGTQDMKRTDDRAIVARLLKLVGSGDRQGASTYASSAPVRQAAAREPLIAVAAAGASFDKSRPLQSDAALSDLARTPRAADAARMQRGLLLVWSGDVTRGREQLALVANSPQSSSRWKRAAGLILAKLAPQS